MALFKFFGQSKRYLRLPLQLLTLLLTIFSFSATAASVAFNAVDASMINKPIPLATITAAKTQLYPSNAPAKVRTNTFNEILDKIEKNLNLPPIHEDEMVPLHLKLDEKGNVLSAQAHSPNSDINKAAELAAIKSSPLPVDSEHPKRYANLIINIKISTESKPAYNEATKVNAIIDKIKQNLSMPVNSGGYIVSLHLRLDKKGNVLSVQAKGSNPSANKAAELAAFESSPLPIDLENPERYANVTINIEIL